MQWNNQHGLHIESTCEITVNINFQSECALGFIDRPDTLKYYIRIKNFF